MRLLTLFLAGFVAVAAIAGCGGGDDGVEALEGSGPPARRPTASWVADSDVSAVVVAGDTVYAGGFFHYVGPRTGSLVFFAPQEEAPDPGWPAFDGSVSAVVSDGSGGWIVGGSFETVGGRRCPGLAHLTREQVLDPRFCLNPRGDVSALVSDGQRVFVGGELRQIGGEQRLGLAAIDLRSGRVLPWRADVTGRPFEARGGDDYVAPGVASLGLDGDTLFVGGFFQRIGGVPRLNLGALDATSAAVLPWRADAPAEVPGGYVMVDAMAVGRDSLYLGGFFTALAGKPAAGLGAVSLASGARTRWNPRADSLVSALVYRDGAVYLATESSLITAVDAEIGAPLRSFQPKDATTAHSVGDVATLTIVDSMLYVGGDFERLGGRDRSNLAALDPRTGRVLPWSPRVNAPVRALAATTRALAIGGDFSSAGGVRRDGLMAIDGRTGRLLPWAPVLDGPALALVANGERLFVGGPFRTVNGVRRTRLAAFDLATRTLTGWAPTLTPRLTPDNADVVEVIDATDERVYVGGDFLSAGGEPRERFAAFDAESGSVTSWAPDLAYPEGVSMRDYPDYVSFNSLAAGEGTVFIAGDFEYVGGEMRDGIAEVDDETGEVTSWNPKVGGVVVYSSSSFEVAALETADNILYVGGGFNSLDGKRRHNLAAVDTDTDEVLPWAPAIRAGFASAPVQDIEVVGDFVAVGGDFRSGGGKPHSAIALLDAATGSILAWRPPAAEIPEHVDSIDASSTVLAFDGYVGGNADSVNLYKLRPAPAH